MTLSCRCRRRDECGPPGARKGHPVSPQALGCQARGRHSELSLGSTSRDGHVSWPPWASAPPCMKEATPPPPTLPAFTDSLDVKHCSSHALCHHHGELTVMSQPPTGDT